MAEITDLIFKRRSIRHYTEQEVTKETLTLLLQAAMAAPSAANGKPWEFVVVNDKRMMAELRSSMPGNYNATAAIAVCANMAIAGSPASERYWQQDCAIAADHILLAATGLGLGSVWLGVYPTQARLETVRGVLCIPESVTPLCLIYLGYPAEIKEPRTQYEERRVHWQQYKVSIVDELA
jgi:nitroreductase